MTDFRNAYRAVRDSVVGFGFASGHNAEICGTGFVLHCKGDQAIVLTNRHVVEGLGQADSSTGPNCAIVFHDRTIKDEHGEDVPFTEIIRCPIPYFALLPDPGTGAVPSVPGFDTVVDKAYARPDIGLAIIDTKGKQLTPASIRFEPVPEEGLPLGLLGYPRGVTISPATRSEHLQCTPILQTGVLGAILPHRSAPHTRFLVDIYSDRGSSGSPLFDATGKVLGVVYAGRYQSDETSLSSQLMAVPLTELPSEFKQALQSGRVADLYSFLSEMSAAN